MTVGPTKPNSGPSSLTEYLGFSRSRGNLVGGLPAAVFALPADELPAIGVKVSKLFFHLQERTSVAHRSLDLHPVADDLRIGHKGLDSTLGIASHFLGIELVERQSIALPLLQHE